MRTALITIIITLTLTGAANASDLTAVQRSQIQDVARTAWAGSPCAGQVNVHWTRSIDVNTLPVQDTGARALLADASKEIRGYAYGSYTGTCDVTVLSTLQPTVACTVAVHEAGHLDGLEHGTSAVMGDQNGEIAEGYIWPGCQGLASLSLIDARGWVYGHVNDMTTVACKRLGASRVQCVSSTPRNHRRSLRRVWRVWATATSVRGARIK